MSRPFPSLMPPGASALAGARRRRMTPSPSSRSPIRRARNFADPLEGWGEALMTKNQSHLALAKFAEADKYAPNWGRLHLNWGEALGYAGRKDEAQKQFARAARLMSRRR